MIGPLEPFVVAAACEFDVRVEDLKVKVTIKTWERRDGSTVIIASGQFRVRLTNLDTGASLVTTISGPNVIRFEGDGVTNVGSGRWLLYGPEEGMWLTSGRLKLTGAGSITDIRATLRGHEIDVCEVLGGD